MKPNNAALHRVTITPDDAVTLYGANKGTLANLRHKKEGPPYLKVGRKVLYPVKEFETWLFSHPVKTIESEA